MDSSEKKQDDQVKKLRLYKSLMIQLENKLFISDLLNKSDQTDLSESCSA